MNARTLRIGDRIRITGIPGKAVPDYYINPDTKRVYKKLIARKRSVRISEIDRYGGPWLCCCLRMKDGTWEWHFLAEYDSDGNWVPVKSRQSRI
jgi:hypothetical protein